MPADVRASYLRIFLVAGLVAATSFTIALADPASSSQSTSLEPKARIVRNYARLPLSFEGNTGRADTNVRFLARGSGYTLYLTGNEAALRVCKTAFAATRAHPDRERSTVGKPSACDVVQMQLAEASGRTEPVGEELLPGTVNYFIGGDPAKWRTGIPTYAKVRYPGVYPGVDLVYYGNQRQIEFDFVVAPGADPQAIRLRFGGAVHLHLTANGDVVVTTASGKLAFHKPLVYQIAEGNRSPVAGRFALLGKHTVGFWVGNYDRAKALVIDPVLAFSTFLGGTGTDTASAVAVDSSQNVYLAGTAFSTDFPVTTGAFQTTNHGAANQLSNAFITKLNPNGTALVCSTYLGGSGGDTATAISVDAAGDVYVTGQTGSADFPVTPGAFQTKNKGAASGSANAFVTELNPTGTALVYSTYLGGSTGDQASAIRVDAAGNAYVTGWTLSTDFPVTSGAYQSTNHAAANSLSNVFVTKVNPAGTGLVYSTYLGGSGGLANSGEGDRGNAIAVDSSGDAFVVGRTFTDDFPVTAGAFQATNKAVANQMTNVFVTKLNPTGAGLVYSTFLGGSGGDIGYAVAVDAEGEAFVAGEAISTDFPVTQGAFQTVNHFGFTTSWGPYATVGPNAFITKLNAAGSSLVYSTYLGGSGGIVNFSPTLMRADGEQIYGLAIDGAGDVYVSGFTASGNFPVTQGAYQTVNNDFEGVVGLAGCTNSCIGGYNAFITELNPAGSALVYSTYLGGNGYNPKNYFPMFCTGDGASSLALDSFGNMSVAGPACSSDFPVSSGAFQATINSPGSAFAAKLSLAPSFTIAGTTVTVKAGATTGNTSTITVTPAGGFTGSVALTAAITSGPSCAQDPPTFSFGSTSPVIITGPSAGTATLTITTTAAGSSSQAYLKQRPALWCMGSGMGLACIVLFGIRPRRHNWSAVLGMLVFLILAGGLLACGGGSNCKGGTSGTTPGTYTITVTGTSGSSTTGTVTLTVQ